MPDPENVFRQYLAALNDRRMGELGDYVHDAILFNGEPTSLSDYRAAIQSNLDAVPDFTWTIEDVLAGDDLIAVRLTDTGTPSGAWLGISPTGKSFSVTEMCFYRLRKGRIGEMWFVLDAATAAKQLA